MGPVELPLPNENHDSSPALPSPRFVWVVTAVWTVLVALIATVRVYTLHSGFFDLGFMVYGLDAFLEGGLSAPVGPVGWSLLEDHFSPLIYPLAPLMLLPARAYVLVVVQALAAGAAAPIIWRILASSIDDMRTAVLAWVAILVHPTLLYALIFDFHITVVALPAFACLALGVVQNRHRLIAYSGVVLAMTREDLAILVLLVAIIAGWRYRRAFVAPALAALVAVASWLATAGGPQYFARTSYGYLDLGSPFTTIGRVVEATWGEGLLVILGLIIVVPWVAFRGLAWRPIGVAIVWYAPLLASALFNTKTIGFHYYAAVGIFAAWALADAGRSAPALTSRRTAIVGGLLIVMVVSGPLGDGAIAPTADRIADYYRVLRDERQDLYASHRALRCIDESQPVSMTSSLVALGRWDAVRVYPSPFAPIRTVRGLYGDGEVVPPDTVDVDLVVLHDRDLNRPDHHPYPPQARVGGLTFYAYELDATIAACLSAVREASTASRDRIGKDPTQTTDLAE